MSRQWNRRITGMVLAVVALLTFSVGQAFADPIMVHQSTSDFYDTGGTLIHGCSGIGCSGPTFSFGDTSGTNTWSLLSSVWANTDSTTFSYSLYNKTLTPNIVSFNIMNNHYLGAGHLPAAPGWSFSQSGAWWSFEASPAHFGLAPGGAVGGFSVVLDGNVPHDFNGTFITLSDGMSSTALNGGQWMVTGPSPVPEPASLLLLGSGLAGFGAWRRRRA